MLYWFTNISEIKFPPKEMEYMGNKYKKIIKTNIQIIREELGYTQKEMGEKLKVGEKTIRNYEYFESNLPLESSLYLSKKFGYSLDWIYRNSTNKMNDSEIIEGKRISNFIVDIRDFISRSDEQIHISIPDYYMNYIKQRNALLSSNLSDYEKKRECAKLDASLKKNTKSFYYRFTIPESEFLSFLHIDNSFIPYVDSDIESGEDFEPTEEQKQEAMAFLDSLLNQ